MQMNIEGGMIIIIIMVIIVTIFFIIMITITCHPCLFSPHHSLNVYGVNTGAGAVTHCTGFHYVHRLSCRRGGSEGETRCPRCSRASALS